MSSFLFLVTTKPTFLVCLWLQLGYGSKGHKIHYSGPLVVPSGNMDQVLKDHDRHIQEAVRRARIDKARVRKHQAEEASSQQVSTNHPSSVSSR